MTGREMQRAVEFELEEAYPDFVKRFSLNSNKIFYFLSRYQLDYINELYDDGLERNEANRTKLGKLLIQTSTTSITPNATYPNGYDVVKPTEVLYALNQRCDLSTGETDVEVQPRSYDFYNVNKENPFRKPDEGRVWRLDGDNFYTIITNGSSLSTYYIDYVKTPTDIDLSNDCELHVSTHPKIVNGAVALILGAKRDQAGYNIQKLEEREK